MLVEVEHKEAEVEISDAMTMRGFYGILLKGALVICASNIILNGRKLRVKIDFRVKFTITMFLTFLSSFFVYAFFFFLLFFGGYAPRSAHWAQ